MRPRCSCSRRTRTRTTRARSSPRRACPGAGASCGSTPRTRARRPTTSSGRATSTRSPRRCSRRATRPPPTARSTSSSSASSSRTARSRRTPRSTGRRSGSRCRWTRSACRSCSPGSSTAPSPKDWRHIRKAADLIVEKGPVSEQERWENQEGYSPATIAAEIAGLVCAADIATRNGDAKRAATYLAQGRQLGRERPALDRDLQRSLFGTSRTTCASPRTASPTAARSTRSATPGPRSSTSAASSTSASSSSSASASSAPTTRSVLNTLEGRRRAAEGRRLLAPLQLRRLRRAPRRQVVAAVPGRHAPDARSGVADLRRRARRVRAARGPPGGRPAGRDGGGGERRRDAARAGLGRPRTDREARASPRARGRSRPRLWPGRTHNSCGSHGRPRRALRWSVRGSSPIAIQGARTKRYPSLPTSRRCGVFLCRPAY